MSVLEDCHTAVYAITPGQPTWNIYHVPLILTLYNVAQCSYAWYKRYQTTSLRNAHCGSSSLPGVGKMNLILQAGQLPYWPAWPGLVYSCIRIITNHGIAEHVEWRWSSADDLYTPYCAHAYGRPSVAPSASHAACVTALHNLYPLYLGSVRLGTLWFCLSIYC